MDFINDDINDMDFREEVQDFQDEAQSGSAKSGEEAFQEDEPQFEATFAEMQNKQVFGEALDARSQKDKPFIVLREAFLQLGQESTFIEKVFAELRQSKTFPFLNAIYVANARLFLKEHKLYSSKNIETWVKNQNSRFGETYLEITDFFRYVKIGEKLFKK